MNNTRTFTAEEVMTLAVTFEQQAQRADTLLANLRTQSPTAGALRSCADTVRRFVAVKTPIIVKVPQDMPIELNPETVALMLKSAAKSLPPVHALYCHRGAAVITRLLEAAAAPAMIETARDSVRLDFLEERSFTLYQNRDPESGRLYPHATFVDEDKKVRRGVLGISVRNALDCAIEDAAEAAQESGA